MDIHIDMGAVQSAVNESITKQVANAAVGYETHRSIAAAIGSAFADGAVMDAVTRGVQSADLDSIANAISKEITRTATKSAIAVMREAMFDAVCKIRNVYTDEDKRRVASEMDRIDLSTKSKTKKGKCVWKGDGDGVCKTGCGRLHVYTTNYTFCPYCGLTLVKAADRGKT